MSADKLQQQPLHKSLGMRPWEEIKQERREQAIEEIGKASRIAQQLAWQEMESWPIQKGIQQLEYSDQLEEVQVESIKKIADKTVETSSAEILVLNLKQGAGKTSGVVVAVGLNPEGTAYAAPIHNLLEENKDKGPVPEDRKHLKGFKKKLDELLEEDEIEKLLYDRIVGTPNQDGLLDHFSPDIIIEVELKSVEGIQEWREKQQFDAYRETLFTPTQMLNREDFDHLDTLMVDEDILKKKRRKDLTLSKEQIRDEIIPLLKELGEDDNKRYLNRVEELKDSLLKIYDWFPSQVDCDSVPGLLSEVVDRKDMELVGKYQGHYHLKIHETLWREEWEPTEIKTAKKFYRDFIRDRFTADGERRRSFLNQKILKLLRNGEKDKAVKLQKLKKHLNIIVEGAYTQGTINLKAVPQKDGSLEIRRGRSSKEKNRKLDNRTESFFTLKQKLSNRIFDLYANKGVDITLLKAEHETLEMKQEIENWKQYDKRKRKFENYTGREWKRKMRSRNYLPDLRDPKTGNYAPYHQIEDTKTETEAVIDGEKVEFDFKPFKCVHERSILTDYYRDSDHIDLPEPERTVIHIVPDRQSQGLPKKDPEKRDKILPYLKAHHDLTDPIGVSYTEWINRGFLPDSWHGFFNISGLNPDSDKNTVLIAGDANPPNEAIVERYVELFNETPSEMTLKDGEKTKIDPEQVKSPDVKGRPERNAGTRTGYEEEKLDFVFKSLVLNRIRDIAERNRGKGLVIKVGRYGKALQQKHGDPDYTFKPAEAVRWIMEQEQEYTDGNQLEKLRQEENLFPTPDENKRREVLEAVCQESDRYRFHNGDVEYQELGDRMEAAIHENSQLSKTELKDKVTGEDGKIVQKVKDLDRFKVRKDGRTEMVELSPDHETDLPLQD